MFQRCFANVETTSINVRRLNFHFQPNINVETTLINVIDSTLMFLLGTCKIMRNFLFPTYRNVSMCIYNTGFTLRFPSRKRTNIKVWILELCLVTFTEEILNGILHFLCSAVVIALRSDTFITYIVLNPSSTFLCQFYPGYLSNFAGSCTIMTYFIAVLII